MDNYLTMGAVNMRISGTTRLAGLLGRPVCHSKSPAIHNIAFERLDIDCRYLNFDVGIEELEAAVNSMRALGAIGFNVTMPDKEAVMKYLDNVSDEARLIGAVNTVLNENGRLTGYNTDGAGYVKSLEDEGVEFRGRKAVICGAGGTARAISIHLAMSGAGEISIFNTTLSRAEALAADINSLNGCKAAAFAYVDGLLAAEIESAAVLINCTRLGMHPNEDKAVISSSDILHERLTVSDVIYEPSPTRLLAMAQAKGLKTIDGLSMVVNQAALAFKIWTGRDMPLDDVYAGLAQLRRQGD